MNSHEKQDQGKPYQRLQNDGDSIKYQISALMDNEIDLDSSLHLMTAIKAGNAAGESWQSYHLIGDVMRGNNNFSKDFKHQLMLKLDTEPTVLAPRNTVSIIVKSSKMPSVWSIAASVAAVAFVSWVALQQSGTSNGQAPQQIAESVPQEYLTAHQAMAPSNAAYFVQDAAFIEPK